VRASLPGSCFLRTSRRHWSACAPLRGSSHSASHDYSLWATSRADTRADRRWSKPSRSAFVLAGLSESDLWRAALQPGNLGLEKVREQKDGRAYLRRCWEAAERFTAAHPGLGDREAARDAIEEIWRVALARAWRGKAGLTAFALLRAHVSTAYSLGRRYGYGLSARHAQELAGIASRRTVVNGHRRLVDGGWLRRLAPRGTKGTAQWELCLPEKCRQVNHSVHAPTCTTVSLHGISSDPWLWSALGKAAERSTRSLRLTRSRSRLAHSRTLRDLV
jgi:hypothetical protein